MAGKRHLATLIFPEIVRRFSFKSESLDLAVAAKLDGTWRPAWRSLEK
jgi:hypothetical protein